MPYSDNLYSMVDSDDDSDVEQHGHDLNQVPATLYTGGDENNDEDILSPTDGYFRAAPETSAPWQSSSEYVPPPVPVPPAVSSSSSTSSFSHTHVPNVWVQDPSLEPGSTANSKAREADEERRVNVANQYQHHHLNNNDDDDDDAYDPPFRGSHSASASRSHYPSSSHHRHRGSSASAGSGSGRQDAYAAYYQPSSPPTALYNPSTNVASSYTSYVPQQQQRAVPYFTPPRDEAPPAYSPSPTSPTNSGEQSRNYSTFSSSTNHDSVAAAAAANMGAPGAGQEETQGLLGISREPESMGAHPEEGEVTLPEWRERMRRRLPYLNWRCGRGLVLTLVLLLITVGFLTSIGGGNQKKPLPDNPIKEPATGDPTNPPMDNKPPSYPEYPDLDNGSFRWGSGRSCKADKIARPTEQFAVSFSAGNQLGIMENISRDDRHSDGRNVQVQGEVVFRRSEPGSPDSVIVLDVIVDDERIRVDVSWNAAAQFLVATVPADVPWGDEASTNNPCVAIHATVWVPGDANLDRLEVETVRLDVKLFDNLSLSVAKETKLVSTVGKIVSASTGDNARDDSIFDLGAPDSFKFRSRIIEAKTTSAPIKGSWPLFDYLGLMSTSGNIKVCIEPKEADKDVPAPATLYIKSLSGNVEFREPVYAAQEAFAVTQALLATDVMMEMDLRAETVLPPRDYRVDVHTTSGNINGVVAFSAAAGFKSTSGTIRVDLLPVLDTSLTSGDDSASFLRTGGTSGNAFVNVLAPLWVDSVKGSYVLPGVVPMPGPGLPEPPTKIPTEKIGDRDPYSWLGDFLTGGDGSDKVTKPEPEVRRSVSAPALRVLDTQHTTTSGDAKFRFASVWEGDLSLSSVSGKLRVEGKGVKIIKAGKDWPGWNEHLLARKGDEGGSMFTAKTTSGDVSVIIGEE
ncbi:hypothetical protein B0H66DRAFT_325349 [Apodospora peruviana]|uniref:Adhesin domain-containing protein n=1 Tax=Apodospora peruviana TaxID=516989 RepID=A0AAE0M0T1_9PEZI|nr:hypothetical protein B0H66DRAFT_325349 [Apodospora peruviana]